MKNGKEKIKTFGGLVEYANERALQSLRRNDPWAWAYWKETAKWAERVITNSEVTGNAEQDYKFMFVHLEHLGEKTSQDYTKLYEFTKALVNIAAEHVGKREYKEAARAYSRAKWLVILARNNGWKMDPQKTGVNLDWLRGFEAVKAGKVPMWA